jgi:hypothetical protein
VDAASYAILGALGSAADHDGHKHAIVGAIGGVLRKAGWTREQCAELIRAWIRDHARDVDAGVQWACGAWDQPSEAVSGVGALTAIVGRDTARVIEESAMLPWRSRRDAMPATEPNVRFADETIAGTDDDARAIRIVDWRDPAPLHFVVPSLDLAIGKVSAIQGFAYTAKSPFASLLALCIASGTPFLGHAVEQRPVLYVDHEGGQLTCVRMARLCAGLGLDRNAVPLHLAESDLFSDAWLRDADALVTERAIGAVFVDTYSSALPIEFGFNDSNFRAWATELGRLSRRTGVLVVVLVHENKSANGSTGLRGISGHGSLAGAVQTSIALSRPGDDPHVIEVSCTRAVRRGFDRFALRWADAPCPHAPDGEALLARVCDLPAGRGVALAPANAARAADRGRAIVDAGVAIMQALTPSVAVSRQECRALGGGSRNAGDEALRRLVSARLVAYSAGRYALTDAGAQAGEIAVRTALGGMGGFTLCDTA